MTTMAESSSARDTCKAFFAETTAHGFSQVVKDDVGMVTRIVWGVLIFLAMVISAVHLGLLCSEYSQYNTREKVYVSSEGPTFPSVTICSKSPIRSTFALPASMAAVADEYNIPLNVLMFENVNLSDAYDIGHEFKQFVFGCYSNSFARVHCDNDSIQVYQSSAFFNCYTIPGGYIATTIGKKTGLTLNVYFNYHDRTNIE